MLDAQDFQIKCDRELDKLYKSLNKAADVHGFDTEFGGKLTIEFEDPPAKFVISPNAPVQQIWVSAHMTSYKLGWSPDTQEFVLPETGQSLKDLIADAVSRQLGEPVQL